MPFFVRIPRHPRSVEINPDYPVGGEHYLNILNGDGTLIQRELRRRGYAGYEPPTAATMCAVFDLLHTQHGTFSFFDVGANGGHYSFLCKCLYRDDVNVVAFEPAPTTYGWLDAINRANQLGLTTEMLAMSDTDADVTLYLSEKSDASNSLNKDFKAKHKGTVTVGCTTLDQYVARTGVVPTFLKIDTETHEENVLRGGEQTIRKHRPMMIVEAIEKGGIKYGRRVSDYLDTIGGYHYYRIAPKLTLEESDHIFTEPKTDFRDWLVSPFELGPTISELAGQWAEVLGECTAESNVVGT